MLRRALLAGLTLWLMGTVVLRFGGNATIPPPTAARTIPVYLVSFLLAGLAARLGFRGMRIPREAWPAAVTLFILPTLVLDAFVTAFFPAVYPNLSPAAAPTFGGLMLISAAGAVVSAWVFRL